MDQGKLLETEYIPLQKHAKNLGVIFSYGIRYVEHVEIVTGTSMETTQQLSTLMPSKLMPNIGGPRDIQFSCI